MADLSLEQKRSGCKAQDRRDSRQLMAQLAPGQRSVPSRMAVGQRSIAKSFMLVLAVMLILQATPSAQVHATRPVNKGITEDQVEEFKERMQQRLRDHQLKQARESSRTGQSQPSACTDSMHTYLEHVYSPYH